MTARPVRVEATVTVRVEFILSGEDRWAPSRIAQELTAMVTGEPVVSSEVAAWAHEVTSLSYWRDEVEP